MSKRATFRSSEAAASWPCHSYKHSGSYGAFFGFIQRSLRRPSGALRSSAKTSASSAVKISWRDFILRFRHALEPMIEPANDVLQALDAMPGLARA